MININMCYASCTLLGVRCLGSFELSMIARKVFTAVFVLSLVGQPLDAVPAGDRGGHVTQEGGTRVHAPYAPCGKRVCDQRTHYCDPVIKNCARCDDDCHPARIGNNKRTMEECRLNCGWFFFFSEQSMSTSSSVKVHSALTTAVPMIDHSQKRTVTANGACDNVNAILVVAVAVLGITVFLALAVIAVTVVYPVIRSRRSQVDKSVRCQEESLHCRYQDNTMLLQSSLLPPYSSSKGADLETTEKVVEEMDDSMTGLMSEGLQDGATTSAARQETDHFRTNRNSASFHSGQPSETSQNQLLQTDS